MYIIPVARLPVLRLCAISWLGGGIEEDGDSNGF